MKVAFDECIPHRLLHEMPSEWITGVAQILGYAGFRDGTLLDLLEEEYDVLVTLDKGLLYQNDFRNRRLGLLRLDLKLNAYPRLAEYRDRIVAAISEAPGRTLILTREGVQEIEREDSLRS